MVNRNYGDGAGGGKRRARHDVISTLEQKIDAGLLCNADRCSGDYFYGKRNNKSE
jgi:hypothetical protein